GVIETERDVGFSVFGLECQRLLQMMVDLATVAGCERFEDRDPLAVSAEHQGERVMRIRVLGKLLRRRFAALDRGPEDVEPLALVLLEIQRVDGGGLVGYRGAQGAELTGRLDRG